MAAERTKLSFEMGIKSCEEWWNKRKMILFRDEPITADNGYRDQYTNLDRVNKLLAVEAEDAGLDSCNRFEY